MAYLKTNVKEEDLKTLGYVYDWYQQKWIRQIGISITQRFVDYEMGNDTWNRAFEITGCEEILELDKTKLDNKKPKDRVKNLEEVNRRLSSRNSVLQNQYELGVSEFIKTNGDAFVILEEAGFKYGADGYHEELNFYQVATVIYEMRKKIDKLEKGNKSL